MLVNSAQAKIYNLLFKGEIGIADELLSYNEHPVKIVTDKLTEKDRLELKKALERQNGYIKCLEKTDFDIGFSHQTAAMYRPGEIETLYWGRAEGEGIETFVKKALKFFASRANSVPGKVKETSNKSHGQWLA